jgi:hypothetical protein
MTTAAFFLLQHAAEHRSDWLSRFYQIGTDAVANKRSGPFAYVIPEATHQADLITALDRGGVEVDFPLPFVAEGKKYPSGTAVIRYAQPYGGYAKALLENQRYPDLRDNSGQPINPYDVTAHTLPLLMDVPVKVVRRPFTYRLPKVEGQTICSGFGESDARVGLYKSHRPAIDEGWTRWVMEQNHYGFSSLSDDQIQSGKLRARFDAIVIPDQLPATILNGYAAGTMPKELTGGLGDEGVKALREFVEEGGTLICLNRASTFAIEQLKLPVKDVVENVSDKQFFVPGSILRLQLDTSHPLTRGMSKESIAWVEDSPVFSNEHSPDVRVIARYPTNENVLLSGWLLGESRIRGQAALVEVTRGKGRVFLFGFRPQYRAQSLATFPLFFNAIELSRHN